MPDASFSATTLAEQRDPLFHAALGRQMASLSRAGLLQAGSDWAMHLAASPGKCLDLVRLALHQNTEMLHYAQACMAHGFAPQGTDAVPVPVQERRFADPLWQRWPRARSTSPVTPRRRPDRWRRCWTHCAHSAQGSMAMDCPSLCAAQVRCAVGP